MAELREMHVSLLDWETRAVLESLTNEIARLKRIAETANDEDEATDAGNDCLELLGLKERLENEAVDVFGKQIIDFDNEAV
ncbi:hypothetical protein BTA51_08040 [Hahella sp. CCB-MM4]|uniref:hypothetical protein n=1 Tax=Hahella sp. (strain CCB-MM4) TaxID=1926491 RepID=UPI000B9BB84B|nr:hypothetical protein [Hahella sp. CCB-MM4]OZG73752.1 hypothetical protein BTA51_08040 [Hahella sp. CCB-MM4]